MSMFDVFGTSQDKKDEKKQISAEERHRKTTQEQIAIAEASKHEDDQMYHAVQEARSDFLKWQQELGDELIDLVLTLKGKGMDENGKIVVIDPNPICNDDFINKVVIPQCKPLLSKNLINSKLDEQRILSMLKWTANEISDAIANSWQIDHSTYGIRFEDFDLVMQLILNTITPTPYRAHKGWTKKSDNEMAKRIEAFTDRPDKDSSDAKGIRGLFKIGG